MARNPRGETSKSELIRAYIKHHRRAKGQEIQEALGAQGVVVTSQLISNTRSRMRAGPAKQAALTPKVKGRGRNRTGGNRRGGRRAAPTTVSVSTLVEAKKLVDKTGSIEAVRQALSALEKLR